LKGYPEFIKKNLFSSCILYVILGLILLISPEFTSKFVCYLFGMILIVFGITLIFSFISISFTFFRGFTTVLGILIAAAGLFIMIHPAFIISLIPLGVGIYLFINSIFKLQNSLLLKKNNYRNWLSVFLFAAVMIVLSLILIMNAFEIATTLIRIIGLFLIANSIFDVWTIRRVSKKPDESKTTVEGQAKEID